jgi:hypothetical protein
MSSRAGDRRLDDVFEVGRRYIRSNVRNTLLVLVLDWYVRLQYLKTRHYQERSRIDHGERTLQLSRNPVTGRHIVQGLGHVFLAVPGGLLELRIDLYRRHKQSWQYLVNGGITF